MGIGESFHPCLVSAFPPHDSAGSPPQCLSPSAGDAFSEEANRRFERYPGQTSNQIV